MTIKNVKYDHRSLPHVITYRAQNSATVGERKFVKGETLTVDTSREPMEGDAVVEGGLIRIFGKDTPTRAVMGVILSAGVDDE